MGTGLNKNLSTPLYQQLVEVIKGKITTGELKENDRLMTEVELSNQYNISRITVRKAMELLVDEDIVIKKQGIGTFVAAKKINRMGALFLGFSDMCEHDGKVPSSVLLTADLINASVTDIQRLQLSEGEKVIRIIRLRKADGLPVVLEENRFSTKYAYLLAEDLTQSIYKKLREHGLEFGPAQKTIDICYATERESKYLEVEVGAALLLQRDTIFDINHKPVHTSKSIINPARYKMQIHYN
ncbi:GntR family transcriptional regulator [Oscillospiraceae bacterium PP1C4]